MDMTPRGVYRALRSLIDEALQKAERGVAAIQIGGNHQYVIDNGGTAAANPVAFNAALPFTTITGKVRLTAGAQVSGGTLAAGDAITFVLLMDGVTLGTSSPQYVVAAEGASPTASATLTTDLSGPLTGLVPGSSHNFGIQATNGSGHTQAIPAQGAFVQVQDLP